MLVRKAGRDPKRAQTAIRTWQDVFPLVETSPSVLISATDLAVRHRFGIWDAVILLAAAAAGCRLLLSEDLQDGFTWGGITIANPFASRLHPLLANLLSA